MRPELEIIVDWIKPNANVLDLGCGDGELLHYLSEKRNVWGIGVEIDHDNVVKCIQKGVNVIESDINAGLANYFSKNIFDCVVMTQTLQAMRRPDRLLDEMLEIGSVGIITFPNMGHWHCRWQLAKGKMPVTHALPSAWYETDNIHLCTIKDFEALCASKNIHIHRRALLDWSLNESTFARLFPNLFTETAMYLVSRNESNV